MKKTLSIISGLLVFFAMQTVVSAQGQVWDKEKAARWGKENPWYCGVNYIPANAINYTAMWDKTSFSPKVMDKELGLMEDLGMKSGSCFKAGMERFTDARARGSI